MPDVVEQGKAEGKVEASLNVQAGRLFPVRGLPRMFRLCNGVLHHCTIRRTFARFFQKPPSPTP